jgi:hypothetical protein
MVGWLGSTQSSSTCDPLSWGGLGRHGLPDDLWLGSWLGPELGCSRSRLAKCCCLLSRLEGLGRLRLEGWLLLHKRLLLLLRLELLLLELLLL